MGNNPCPSYGRKLPQIIKNIVQDSYDFKKDENDPEVKKLFKQIESSFKKLKVIGRKVNEHLKKSNEYFLYYKQPEYFMTVLKCIQVFYLVMMELPNLKEKKKANQSKENKLMKKFMKKNSFFTQNLVSFWD